MKRVQDWLLRFRWQKLLLVWGVFLLMHGCLAEIGDALQQLSAARTAKNLIDDLTHPVFAQKI